MKALKKALFRLFSTRINFLVFFDKDPLTKLAKPKYCGQYLESQWKKHQYWNSKCSETVALSLILCDIDFFIRFADYFGHPTSDRLLEKIGKIISRQNKYPCNLVARIAGDEFAIVLPATNLEKAVEIAKKIKSDLKPGLFHSQ